MRRLLCLIGIHYYVWGFWVFACRRCRRWWQETPIGYLYGGRLTAEDLKRIAEAK